MTQEAPTTLPQFMRMFPDDEACARYLYKIRYPDGFVCPVCGDTRGYDLLKRRLIECGNGHQISITAHTVMHRTKQPLTTWFYAAYLVSTLTPGISAVQFQRQLGIGRYETAFNMLHKLRAGLVDPERTPLSGRVEVDEAFVGGREDGKPGRGAVDKTLVVIGVEVVPYLKEAKKDGPVMAERAGRIRAAVIPNAEAATLLPWVQKNVAKGSTVLTDGWAGYNGLAALGYTHERVLQTVQGKKTGHFLPMVHLIVSNLKRWILGTHKGAVLPHHMQAYLNEFVFRFNRRFWRGPAFTRALGLMVSAETWPEYDTLYGVEADEQGAWVHPNPAPTEVDELWARVMNILRKQGGDDAVAWALEHEDRLREVVALAADEQTRGEA